VLSVHLDLVAFHLDLVALVVVVDPAVHQPKIHVDVDLHI
jgi:hypothetical protein